MILKKVFEFDWEKVSGYYERFFLWYLLYINKHILDNLLLIFNNLIFLCLWNYIWFIEKYFLLIKKKLKISLVKILERNFNILTINNCILWYLFIFHKSDSMKF